LREIVFFKLKIVHCTTIFFTMITTLPFGTLQHNTIAQLTIQNELLQCSSINLGATITNITVTDKNGIPQNIVVNLPTLGDYVQYASFYLGAICGRYANRIQHGKFNIVNNEYTLATNLGKHHLHGGVQGFNLKFWQAATYEADNKITYSYTSPDGEEGYPGNLQMQITYSLQQNKLVIDYKVTTDKATPINLTNHSYFNLSGGTEATIHQHELQLFTNQILDVDADLIPSGKINNTDATIYDFTTPKLLDQQYKNIALYDNSWVLQGNGLQKAATVTHNHTGLQLNCYTTKPSIHFYDGHFLATPLQSKQGLCLEAQFLPNSPNQPNFPNTILQPNELWQHQTVYEIGVMD
jgi:aldose 1-epimerase